MKPLYVARFVFMCASFFSLSVVHAQTPTQVSQGLCPGIVADFNSSDNGFNSPSIYGGSIFDSSFYYNASRGYWTDYLPPLRTGVPGAPRVMNIISPPYANPNQNGTFNVGFTYIVNNPAVDRFQVRIVSVTQTPTGTIADIVATSGPQFFSAWSTPVPYSDATANPAPADPTPLMTGFTGNVCIRLIDQDIVNGPNTTFRVEIAYIISTPFYAALDNVSIGPLNIPLPVNFIGLVAKRDINNNINIKWDVSEEVDVREYIVERSFNGGSFVPAGSVGARGKTIYGYTDNTVPPTATVYYRIKSVDLDGRTKYSGVLKLKGDAMDSYGETLVVFPVPAKDVVTVEHKLLTNRSRMMLVSSEGKVIRNIQPTEGSSHTTISLTGLAQGIYYLRLDDGQGFGKGVKIVKQ